MGGRSREVVRHKIRSHKARRAAGTSRLMRSSPLSTIETCFASRQSEISSVISVAILSRFPSGTRTRALVLPSKSDSIPGLGCWNRP